MAAAGESGSVDLGGSGEQEPEEIESPFEALEEWKRKVEAGEIAARDEAECTTLVKQGQDEGIPIVAAGSMRLQGNFEGIATTSTHQLELAVGLDLEMPSQVAAEAMRQMAARTRSPSPFPGRMLGAALPDPDERPSLFSSLASFFRRDARQAQQTEDDRSVKWALPDLQIKLDGQDSSDEVARLEEERARVEEERNHLVLELSEAQGQVVQLQSQVQALTDERDDVAGELEATHRGKGVDTSHMDGLKRQAELTLKSNAELSAQLSGREQELRDVEGKLEEALQELEAARLELSSERKAFSVAQTGLERSLAGARAEGTAGAEESAFLKAQVGDLLAHVASLETQLASAAAPAEGQVPLVYSEQDLADKLRESDERLRDLTMECDALQQQLTSSFAGAQSSQVRIAELEAEIGAFAARAAEAQMLSDDARRSLEEHMQEADGLRQQVVDLQEELAVAATPLSPAADKQVASPDRASQASKLDLEEQLSEALRVQASLEEARVKAEAEVRSLRAQSNNVRRELDKAKQELAAALAAKAASETQTSHAEAVASRLQKERGQLNVRTDELAGLKAACEKRAQKLGQDLQSTQARLDSALADGNKVSAELEQTKAKAQADLNAISAARAQKEEAVKAAAAANLEAEELRKRCDEEGQLTSKAAQGLEKRLEATGKELAAAKQKAQQALSERDEARRELREAEQGSLSETAQLREELHQARQDSSHAQGLEEENTRLKRRCSGLEAARDTLAQELNVARAVPTQVGAPPVLLQDPTGACLIRSFKSTSPTATHGSIQLPVPTRSGSMVAPATTAMPVPVPSGPGRKIGKITHVGTTIGPYGHSGSFVAAPPSPSHPTSPTGISGRPMTPMTTAAPVTAPTMLSPRVVTAPAQMVRPVAHASAVRIMTPAGPVKATMTVKVLGARRIQR